jgi:exosortase C (VPDSG-CTERM-specific)
MWAAWRGLSHRDRIRIGGAIGWTFLATMVSIQPIEMLVIRALRSDLDSYIPLVPFIAGYLLYVRRHTLPPAGRASIVAAAVTVGLAAAAFAATIKFRESQSANDALTLTALAYVALIAAGGFLFFGSRWMAAAAFPVAFLIFLVPLPDAAVNWLETASVLASADVSAFFFRITGTPILRDGSVFALPTIVIRVAQECSGIRSSWVLFITSLIASDLFLETRWRRVLLVLFVFPLAIVRNAFRILVIGLLCVHVGPHMINSVIHRRGGPLFFALSLIPLSLFLYWLYRGERHA